MHIINIFHLWEWGIFDIVVLSASAIYNHKMYLSIVNTKGHMYLGRYLDNLQWY